jgi:hypothetical protein
VDRRGICNVAEALGAVHMVIYGHHAMRKIHDWMAILGLNPRPQSRSEETARVVLADP